jgi:hypothetical protein
MRAKEVHWIEFKSSLVWADLKESMEEEIKLLQIDLESPEYNLDQIRYIQGKLCAMRYFLQFPDNAMIALRFEEAGASNELNNKEE